MTKKSIVFLSIFLATAVLIAGGVLWYSGEVKKGILEERRIQEQQLEQEKQAEFNKYNKVLPEAKITGVKDIEGPYKKVTINNGEITFSFEVPDNWLTETRNSGEVEMSEEELREFLGTKWDGNIKAGEQCWQAKIYDTQIGDFVMKEQCGYPTGNYWDFTWNMLKDMSYAEMKGYYDMKRNEFSPGYPQATVTPDNKIWYGDLGWDQIHFYVLHEPKDEQYLHNVGYCYDISCLQQRYASYRKNTEDNVTRDMEGNPIIDKDNNWGFGGYLRKDDRVLRIWKEAYVEGDFEDGFQHILDTLQIDWE